MKVIINMEDTVLALLLFIFLIVGGTLGSLYWKNRHLVTPGKPKPRNKKDKENWSIGG